MSSLFPGGGTYFSIQLDGLGDVHESVRDPFDLHCRFFYKHASPQPSSEFINDDISFDGARDVGEENINFADIGVVTPIIQVFWRSVLVFETTPFSIAFHKDMQSLAIPIWW